jgi:hypothetical protein
LVMVLKELLGSAEEEVELLEELAVIGVRQEAVRLMVLMVREVGRWVLEVEQEWVLKEMEEDWVLEEVSGEKED